MCFGLSLKLMQGMYDHIIKAIHTSSDSPPSWKRMLAGSVCGAMGALSCNPFELVKTRLQSASPVKGVGHQHHYNGVVHALTTIFKEGGIKALYRGSALSMGRSMLGSGANLTSFSLSKEYMLKKAGFKDSVAVDMFCGSLSGVISCIFMNPIDVVRTRYYNQPFKNGQGKVYKSGVQAISLIFKNEGFKGFYKGPCI
jgi:solute carrier family 25 protein 34/35